MSERQLLLNKKFTRPTFRLYQYNRGPRKKFALQKTNGAPKMLFAEKHFGERKNSGVNERQLFNKDKRKVAANDTQLVLTRGEEAQRNERTSDFSIQNKKVGTNDMKLVTIESGSPEKVCIANFFGERRRGGASEK